MRKMFKTTGNTCMLAALLFYSLPMWGQQSRLQQTIEKAKSDGTIFKKIELFSYSTSHTASAGIYHELRLDKNVLSSLVQNKPDAITLAVPVSRSRIVETELIQHDLGSALLKENKNLVRKDIVKPVVYRGTIKNITERTMVLLTINHDFVSLSLLLNSENIFIEKEPRPGSEKLFLTNTSQIRMPLPQFSCGTEADESAPFLQQPHQIQRPEAIQDKCIYVFIECFDSLYVWRNSSYQQTINYVFALFNNVATGFLNEQINVKISTINIWTSNDPYRGDTRENALADLASYYQDDYWGHIGVGLDYSVWGQSRSGIAGKFNGCVKGEGPNQCGVYTASQSSFCYNDLDYNVSVQNFPTGPSVTQPAVYLVMHEMGHLFGSPHTQWCGWTINTNPFTLGALDNCAAVEGTCSPGNPPPASGGTIMSYCVSGTNFVNFNNGFGTLPGNRIRTFLDGQACISNCPLCAVNGVIGNLGLGPNHYEVSNSLTANGTLPAGSITVLDAGNRVTLSPGFRANNGSTLRAIINGCGGQQKNNGSRQSAKDKNEPNK